MKRKAGENRTLVVLGAAIGVFETYRAAHRLGLRTLAIDMRADAPALHLADESLILSTRDVNAIHDALKDRTDLCGIVAPASDIALCAQRELASRLGLPCGLSRPMVRASQDKVFLRQLCDIVDLPSCEWVSGDPDTSLVERASSMAHPVVVKPVDAQGSRGVARCADPSLLQDAVAEAAPHSYSGRVMVEEEILGRHLSVEAVIVGGRAAFVGISLRRLTPAPRAITTEHAMPAPLAEGVEEQVRALVDRVCAVVDYRCGPLMLDLVIDDDGRVRIVELGARVGGDPLGELVRLSYGIDTVEQAVRIAVDMPLTTSVHGERRGAVGRILLPEVSGTVGEVRGVDSARSVDGVTHVRVGVVSGDEVRGGDCLADQLGYVLATAVDVPGARRQAAAAAAALDFGLRPGIEMSTIANDALCENATAENTTPETAITDIDENLTRELVG